MNVLILMGSPRLRGNTAELAKPFMEELKANGADVRYMTLADKNIGPGKGCYACQYVDGEYGCVQRDDMYDVVEGIRWADIIVLATPIYAWYCPGPMKNVLDRHYGLNKFYGSAHGSPVGRKAGGDPGHPRLRGRLRHGPLRRGRGAALPALEPHLRRSLFRPGRGRPGVLPDARRHGKGKGICPKAPAILTTHSKSSRNQA